MVVLCYYENESQLARLLQGDQFQGFERINHDIINVNVNEIVEATLRLLEQIGFSDVELQRQVLRVENYQNIFRYMANDSRKVIYAMQVVYKDQSILGGPKIKAPVPVTGEDEYMPSVASLMGISMLINLHDDNIDVMSLESQPR